MPGPNESSRETMPRIPGLKPVIKDYEPRSSREGQTFAGESIWIRYINFVKLPHTLFALPFALLGVVYASFSAPVTVSNVGLVVLAFTAARVAAMGFNRIADRRFDALNPRTKGRELPRGALTVRQGSVAVVVASAVFVMSAAFLNPLCFALSPFALAWILAYSYSKRFTSWSHIWLGMSLAIAPAGGYLAVTGTWSDPWWTLPVLAIGVLTWVAGFDIFYALPDEDFDRRQGLKSVVVLLGRHRAILIGKSLHALTIMALLAFGVGAEFGVAYYVGVAAATGILAYEHQLVRPDDLTRLNAAFFTMNGVMSVVVFIGALIGRFV